MKRKKFLDFKNPMVIVSIVAICGAAGTGIVTLAKFITLPSRVEAVEKTTNQIADYIKQQQIYNQAVQDILKKDGEKEEIIYSPDKKLFWNEILKEWRPIKELKPHE